VLTRIPRGKDANAREGPGPLYRGMCGTRASRLTVVGPEPDS